MTPIIIPQGKSHAALLSRTTHDWETQRKRLEREHGELLVRVGQLAEQVTLEQRLGIAQLCLLLTVLVCMALTRGGGFVMDPYLIEGKGTKRAALREWGRRHLSSFSSGEWAAKFSGRATSTTPKPTESKGTTSGASFSSIIFYILIEECSRTSKSRISWFSNRWRSYTKTRSRSSYSSGPPLYYIFKQVQTIVSHPCASASVTSSGDPYLYVVFYPLTTFAQLVVFFFTSCRKLKLGTATLTKVKLAY